MVVVAGIPLALILFESTRFKPFILFERGIGRAGDNEVVFRACDTEFECFSLGLPLRPLAIVVCDFCGAPPIVRCLLLASELISGDCDSGGPTTIVHLFVPCSGYCSTRCTRFFFFFASFDSKKYVCGCT